MVYRARLEELSQSGDWKSLLALGEEAIHSDTVNDVLIGVVAADRAGRHGIDGLEVAYDAGKLVGSLFRFEASRVWREYPIQPQTLAAFEAQAYRGGSNPTSLKYRRDRDHALIIQGDESRYLQTGEEFKGFLVEELGFNPENVIDFFSLTQGINVGSHGTMEDARDAVLPILRATASNLVQKAGRHSNLVLYHNGHGVDGSFYFIDAKVPYRDWAKPLLGNVGNILVVNDASEASSMHKALVDTGVSQTRLMTLSACPIGQEGYGNIFSRAVMEAYRNGRPYAPEPKHITEIPCSLIGGIVEGGEIKVGIVGEVTAKADFTMSPVKSGVDLDYMLMKFLDTQTLA